MGSNSYPNTNLKHIGQIIIHTKFDQNQVKTVSEKLTNEDRQTEIVKAHLSATGNQASHASITDTTFIPSQKRQRLHKQCLL